VTDWGNFGHGLYFDRKGQPIDMPAWGEKFGDREYQIVAQHWVRGWMISTVWLGIDHGFGRFLSRGAPYVPIIFETMIFAPGDVTIGADDDLDEYQERYATEEAAQAGHDRALAAVVERLGPDSVTDITGPLVPGSSDEVPDWDREMPC